MRWVRTAPAPGFSLKKSINDTSFYLADAALISDDDIQAATTDTSALNPGLLMINVRLKPGAAARLYEFTQRHVGERVVVLLSGEVSGTPPIIRTAISGPAFTIEGMPARTSKNFAAAVAARWPSPH